MAKVCDRHLLLHDLNDDGVAIYVQRRIRHAANERHGSSG